mgnify:CR=1 FL=1
MAKAILAETERDPALDREAMILMVPGYLWNTLVMQAKEEGSSPGAVFSKALEAYLKEHGSQEVADYLWKLARERR